MSIRTRIEGQGNGPVAAVVEHERHEAGLVVYNHPIDHYSYSIQPMASDEYGVDMAINPAAVAPTLTLIHNGTDNAGWTGANVSGAGFVFNSTAQAFDGTRSIDGTGSSNNRAGFTAPAPVNPTGFTSLQFAMYITSFPTSGTKDVTLQFFSAGAPVGNEISVKAYVNTLSFNSWQQANIPLADFGLAGVTEFDELQVRTVDSGAGQPPNYFLDAINLVTTATGSGTAEYKFVPMFGENYSLLNLRVFAYNTGKTSADPTEFFGLPALSGGFELVLRNRTRVFLSLIARDLWDFIRAPNCTVSTNADGSTGATFIADFKIPVEHMLINGSEGAFVEVRVKDDLTGLARLETSLHLAKLEEE